MRKCAYCGKENDDQGEACSGCGTTLATEPSQRPLSGTQRAAAQSKMLWGAVWCVGGLTITLLTYSLAAPGGTYILAWGAIVFGAIRFFQGLSSSSGAAPDYNGEPSTSQLLLEQGALLEGADRAAAIAKYQEIVKLFPRTRAAAEAKRNIQTLKAHGPKQETDTLHL